MREQDKYVKVKKFKPITGHSFIAPGIDSLSTIDWILYPNEDINFKTKKTTYLLGGDVRLTDCNRMVTWSLCYQEDGGLSKVRAAIKELQKLEKAIEQKLK